MTTAKPPSTVKLIEVDTPVDVAESGDTMRAAGLHAIATLLTTEAVLIASKHTLEPRSANSPSSERSSPKPHDPSFVPLIQRITSRIAGVVASSRYVLLLYNIKRDMLEKAKTITPGRRAPTISPLEEPGWVAVNVMVESAKLADAMDRLEEMGAEDILVTKLENCRV